jgi:ParB family chromosome partitioning protein
MNIDHIPLDRLSVSKANMRAGKKPPDITDILPSIIKRGVISPLFIRPNCQDGHFEIVAGKRRYYASLEAARQGKDDVTLPCITLAEGDDADALEISMIENMLRQAPDQVTQWESYTRLVKEGRSVEDIAATFALTELQVKRILALGNLLPRIREAFRAEEIDAPTVKHLTLATKAQQKAWLALFEDKEGYAPRGSQLKAWLFGGASISTSMALFDLADFDGAIVKDFFEEDGYFADADQFWAAQGTEIEQRKAAYLEDGWSSVEIIPPGTHFNDWQYERTPKRKGGRVYIQVKAKGEVIFHEGYLTDKEARRRDDETSGTIKQPAPARPEITSAMTSYIDLHRHAAVRSALAAQPSLALRVMVAHAICGSPLWRVEVQDQRSRNAAVTESIETCVAEARFDERRRAVLEVLGGAAQGSGDAQHRWNGCGGFDPESPEVTKGHEPEQGITGLFARLLEIPDRTVLEVLAIVMAETLASGSCLIESIGLHIGVDMAEYWVADDAFYGLIRDREVLTAILSEVGGTAVAQAHAAEKTKVIKSVINDFLTGENGRTKQEHWVPRWMAFPPTAYTERGGVATVAAANRVRWQAEVEVPLDPASSTKGAAEVTEDGDAETADALEEAEEQRLAA